MLKITEIFNSIQGEGLRSGQATTFVRLSGCNLRCKFCDTKYSWKGGKKMTEGAIARKLKLTGHRWAVITGGEPLHQSIETLCRILRFNGHKIQVETNGSIQPSEALIDLVDHWTVSPKGVALANIPVKEYKYVVTAETATDLIPKRNVPIYLQPDNNKPEMIEKCIEAIKNRGDLRLSVQLHKILKIR